MSANKICLLIDDDIDDHEFFAMAMHKIDSTIQCRFANNGIEGLKTLAELKSSPPILIFIDLNMPRMGGKECLLEIKKMSAFSQIPKIIYSTSSDMRVQSEMIALGASKYLIKPLKIARLVEDLTSVFKEFAPNARS